MNDRRVLVADDNEDIRRDIAKILGGSCGRRDLLSRAARLFPDEKFAGDLPDHEGFEVESVGGGDAAVELARDARRAGRPFAVAFVDVRMPPGLDGARVARLLREEDEDIEVVLITAYADRTIADLNRAAGGPRRLLLLKKPYAREEVIELALSLHEKRATRRELRAARVRLDSVLESTRDGIVGLDRDHRIAFANGAARELLGIEGDGDGLWERLRANGPRSLPRGDAIELEVPTSRGRRWLEIGEIERAATAPGVDGVFAVRDITARKELERLKDEFVQNTSHELRTPLVAVRGYLDLALDGRLGPLDEKVQRGLEVARRASLRLLGLVDAILELSRLEAEGAALSLREVELGPILARVTDVAAPAARAKNLELRVDVAPDLRASADEPALELALRNLVDNAIKFTERGEVQVRAARAGDRVAIEVLDSGPGLPAAVAPAALFERFRQGDGSLARTKGGAGIGLSLVKRIVELHGGTIEAGNRPEGGARFAFALETGAVPSATPRGGSVALVGAEPTASFVRFALEASGRPVDRFDALEDALARAADGAVGLAIIDGGGGGGETICERAAAAIAALSPSPRLVLLADPGRAAAVRARAPSATVLEKPIALGELARLLRDHGREARAA